MRTNIFLQGFVFLLSLGLGMEVCASEWSGAKGNWSSDGVPGWNGTGVPNEQGAIAFFGSAANNPTVTMDLANGACIGQLLCTKGCNFNKGASATYSFIFDMDGTGPGAAVISNASPGRLSFGSGNILLEDDLMVYNLPLNPSSGNTYGIGGNATFVGKGNLIFVNNQNTYNQRITFGAACAHEGNAEIRSGAVGYQVNGNKSLFGAKATAANYLVTLGSVGGGDATLYMAGSGPVLWHPFTTVSGSEGVLKISSNKETKNWNCIIDSMCTMTLQDDLVLEMPLANEGMTGTFTVKGAIEGEGGLEKVGLGIILFTAANTYAGGTRVKEGVLVVSGGSTVGVGDVSVDAGASLVISNALGIAEAAGVSLGYVAADAEQGVEEAYGVLELAMGGETVVRTLSLNGRLQPKGTYGAEGSGAKTVVDSYLVGDGVLRVLEGPPLATLFFVR